MDSEPIVKLHLFQVSLKDVRESNNNLQRIPLEYVY